jgi:hypothetical protein
LAADLIDNGIHICGGGALLRGMDTVLANATGLNVQRVEDPLSCVARGTSVYLENLELWKGSMDHGEYDWEKQIRVSRRMLFTCFMLAALIFFFTPQKVTNKFQFAFARFFRWPLSIGRSISLSLPAQQPVTGFVSRREYDQLQNSSKTILPTL